MPDLVARNRVQESLPGLEAVKTLMIAAAPLLQTHHGVLYNDARPVLEVFGLSLLD